jgi:copper chaperone CopZ
MKVKIIVVADIDGPINSDMHAEVDEMITNLPYVNGVTEVYIDPVPKKRRS